MPLISYDSLLTFAKLFGGAILIIWIAYECRPVRRRRSPDVLPPPRCDLIARGGRDHWSISDIRIINTGDKREQA